jgi:Tfp pilus assembly protein PilF
VYANQGRTKQAQSMFETASRSGTKNLWLWTNWGELLLAQGQEGRAIERFRQAIQSPRGEAANDRARMQAYAQLISIYGRRGDDDSLDALYRRRHSDYPDSTCAGLAYARFLEARRGDKAAAVAIRKTLRGDRCEA